MADTSRRRVLLGALGTAGSALALRATRGLAASFDRSAASSRRRWSFDSDWRFSRSDFAASSQIDFDDRDWRSLRLPHDWSIEGPFDPNAPSAGCGAYLPTGVGWYRKRFTLPSAAAGRRLTIEFDGIYQNSEAWINGQSLGKRPYGFVPFYYDLSTLVRPHAENLIAVRVDNSHQTNCRWYSGSGIYRHAWLLSTEPLHIAHWGVLAHSSLIAPGHATVAVSVQLDNDSSGPAPALVTARMIDAAGRKLGLGHAEALLDGHASASVSLTVSIDDPHLWSPEEPYLHRLIVSVQSAGVASDAVELPFGIRTARFDADRGFLLNDRPLKLNGCCLHHDAGCVGAAVPERVWERRLLELKSMGCNAIRTSHNPFAAEFLDLCDRLGILVMNEAFDEWTIPKGQIGPNGYARYFDQWYERDLQNFIRRDRNHACVVLWSAGNEIGEQGAAGGADVLRRILAVFRAEDPTRMVTAGCDHIASDPPAERARPEFLQLLDVVGYNYVDRWRERTELYYDQDRHDYPQRRFIGTESVGLAGVRGGDGPYLALPGARPGREVDVEQLWKFVRVHDYVAGDFMWTGIDYLGEARWPNKAAASGVLDTCGFRKDSFYFYQSQWTQDPVLHLFPHWNWAGREGQIVPVGCYTNCDTVELFLNGRSLGVKGYAFPRPGMEERYGHLPERALAARTTGDLHLSWDVAFEPGTLRALGRRAERVVADKTIETTGPAAAIALSADAATIGIDPGEVAHVEIRIVDSQGRLVPTADDEIALSLSGDGVLLGWDNGNPANHDGYRSERRRVFGGLALAIVRSSGNAGRMHLSARSEALGSASTSIRCR
ncbi:MAG TPA: glycoside hydrolase family 2 TIM barrel-domain containing protein [Steroidobacteraceae bacterium]|jgi:beta-galactosidase